MVDTVALLAAASVCLAGVMTPGPNFVAVSHRAVSTTRHQALSMVLGISLVNILWAAISVFGIGVILATSPSLFILVKAAGGIYLVWFGLRLIRRPAIDTPSASQSVSTNTRSAVADGVTTNLANPSSMMFYASVFAGAVPDKASNETMLFLVVMVGCIGLLWYGLVALVFSTSHISALYRRVRKIIEIGCGLFLIIYAVRTFLGH